MEIDHIHFYVEDAQIWRDWFVQQLGFQSYGGIIWQDHTQTEVVKSGAVCFFVSSALSEKSLVAEYLRSHPPGVADVAFRVTNLEKVMAKAITYGAKICHPIKQEKNLKWSKILAWGDLSHTLIEGTGDGKLGIRDWQNQNHPLPTNHYQFPNFTSIDHVVLNVAAGDLEPAINWYEKVLGFQRQQTFAIQTDWSALQSQVLIHPHNMVQFPINQPASANSQIQEFLDFNCGPGIQHIALQTANLVEVIKTLRASSLAFLEVPPTYYEQLAQRANFSLSKVELGKIQEQQILVDWQQDVPEAKVESLPLLLQIFTQPIFGQPTFFFELIERRICYVNGEKRQAQGFGQGNFRALFEAIEREQMKRGSLRTGDWVR